MLVFLSKFIPQLIYPFVLIGALIFLALLIREPRVQRAVLILALAILFIGGNRWIAMSLVHSLENQYRLANPPPQADAIVVLGGGTESADAPRVMPEVNGAGDRIFYAAWLYRQQAAPVILVSGGLLDWTSAPSTPAQDMAALLEFMGIPKQDIWEQGRSRNTYEDARYSAELLRKNGARRILLVTSAWHMPRAVQVFAAQDLEVIPAPTDFLLSDGDWNNRFRGEARAWILALLPNVDNLSVTTKMLKEYLGMLYYALMGWS